MNKPNRKPTHSEQEGLSTSAIIILIILFGIGLGLLLGYAYKPSTVRAEEYDPKDAWFAPVPKELLDTLSEPKNAVLTEESLLCVPHPPLPVDSRKAVEIKSGTRVFDAELQAYMVDMCDKYEIPFALALALAETESGFNPNAKSHTNDYGLMQINAINFSWLRAKGLEPMDYKGNIESGIMMISDMVKKYSDYGLALMAYNCGEGGARSLWNRGVYSTQYSRTVMERYYKWDAFLGGL